MNDLYKFMLESPWLSFFMVCVVVPTIAQVIMFLYNRPMRFINMWRNGYPPEHCDADGDFKKLETDAD